MAKKKINQDEKVLWAVVRGIILLCVLLFIGYLTFWRQPCDIDAVFLNCRITGTLPDIIGISLFLFGAFIMTGIHKGFDNLMNPPNSSYFNTVTFIGMVAGIIMFWNW